ncbi:UNVERIFIED_CONTAM: Major facilitator super domain-containing protein 7 [Siphonaria sp. JEL0065]|nr:Major facilitator super domain-containing protein 7 [Siphonaria sp. JEL0065]
MLYAGSAIIGAASPLSADAVTKAAAHWFSGEGRLTANAIMGLATPLGGAAGFLLAPMIVNGDPANVDTFNLVLFGMSLGLGLLSLLVFNSPPTPPSASAKQGTIGFIEGLKQIRKNVSFWILCAVFTGVYCSFQVMSTYLSNYVIPYGFSENDAGNLGIAMVASGVVFAVIAGVVLDRIKKHQLALRVFSLIMFLGTVGFYLGTTGQTAWLTYLGSAFIGIGGLPVMSIAFELGAECTFPVAEATSTGLLMTVSQVFSIIMLLLSNALKDEVTGKMSSGIASVIALSVVAVGGSLCYKSENRRMILEQNKGVEEVELGSVVVEQKS